MDAQFDVFLSHNSKDKPMVRQLAEALRRRGLRVWLDEWELTPGRPWQKALEEIIETTRSAVVAVGQDGVGPWQAPEMGGCLAEFVSRNLPVIPVLLPDAPQRPKLPLFLTGFTWVDLRAGGLDEANLDRLEWGVTGRRPTPRPASEPPPEPSPEPVRQPKIPPSPKQSNAKRNWALGVAAAAGVGLLLAVIGRMPTSPPATPPVAATTPAATTQSATSPAKDPTPPLAQEFQDKLKDGSQGPTMVKIRGGRFLMGSPVDEPGRNRDERQHEVQVDDFAIGKYEVTFEEYDHFAEATGREKPADAGWGRDQRPVINVSWFDTMAYADWLSQQTGKRYRLPTEAEWEYAARAGTQTAYWWGADIGRNHANCDGCGSRWDNKQTAPVGSFPANPFGLYDTAGNVWEWTCSTYDKDYGGAEQRCVADKSSDKLNNHQLKLVG